MTSRMFSIAKLEKLPSRLRLRKIARIIQSVELDLAADRTVDTAYVASVLQLALRDLPEDGIVGRADRRHLDLRAEASASESRRYLNGVRHRILGFLGSEAAEWDFIDLAHKLDPTCTTVLPARVFLEDLRSPYNVGAIFRTAEAFGVERIFLTQHTPSPLHPRAAKTARGTVDSIPWQVAQLADLSQEGVFALELGGTSIAEFRFPRSGVVLIGSEELGLSPEALRMADESAGRATIPLCGAKRSLNVAVAFGILMFLWHQRLVRKN